MESRYTKREHIDALCTIETFLDVAGLTWMRDQATQMRIDFARKTGKLELHPGEQN